MLPNYDVLVSVDRANYRRVWGIGLTSGSAVGDDRGIFLFYRQAFSVPCVTLCRSAVRFDITQCSVSVDCCFAPDLCPIQKAAEYAICETHEKCSGLRSFSPKWHVNTGVACANGPTEMSFRGSWFDQRFDLVRLPAWHQSFAIPVTDSQGVFSGFQDDLWWTLAIQVVHGQNGLVGFIV